MEKFRTEVTMSSQLISWPSGTHTAVGRLTRVQVCFRRQQPPLHPLGTLTVGIRAILHVHEIGVLNSLRLD